MEYKFTINEEIKDCTDCPCMDDDWNACGITRKDLEYKDLIEIRPDWCPLQEINTNI
jgi:hypothetical protein